MKYKGNIIWTIFRTATFWIVGLMSTLFIQKENAGTWQHYLGFAVLAIALIDTLFLVFWFRKRKKEKDATIT